MQNSRSFSVLSLRFPVLFFLVNMFCVQHALAQEENALPPGPARLHGTILVGGKPYENAAIIFFFERDKKVHYTRFRSDNQGRFTVYVFDDGSNPMVAVFLSKRLCFTFTPKDYIPGNNYLETYHVNPRAKMKLTHRPYRKTLKSIDL